MHVRRPTPAGVLLILLLVAGAVTLAVVAPEIYTGTFSDAETFLRVAGLVVVLTSWALLVMRFVPRRRLARILAAAPAVVVASLLVWPYLRPATEVDEAFPPVAAETASSTTPAASRPATPTQASSTPSTTSVPPADAPSGATPELTTTTGAEPVEITRGGFQGLTGHRGSGDAALYRLADGSTLLRFEEVDIGSGPQLDVYLVPGTDRRDLDGALRVAPLTAERGNQNYEIPEGVDLSIGPWTVLVWCETFAVEIANATLSV